MYWHRWGQSTRQCPRLREGLGVASGYGAHFTFVRVDWGTANLRRQREAHSNQALRHRRTVRRRAEGRTRRNLPNLGADPIKWFHRANLQRGVIPLFQTAAYSSAHALLTAPEI